MTDPAEPATEPTDADRALVAAAIEGFRISAKRAGDDGDAAEELYYGGIADLLELCDIPSAVTFIRERSLRALTGAATGIQGVPARSRPGFEGPSGQRWLDTWWLTHRTRKAREALNRERARHGLPPVVRNLMARADDWD